MEWIYFTYRSITYAQRGEKALREENISCILTRTPRWMEKRGCSYALKLNAGKQLPAQAVLKQQGLPWQKAYVCDERGGVREL